MNKGKTGWVIKCKEDGSYWGKKAWHKNITMAHVYKTEEHAVGSFASVYYTDDYFAYTRYKEETSYGYDHVAFYPVKVKYTVEEVEDE